jgi:uncharacterized protein (DUF697 family)
VGKFTGSLKLANVWRVIRELDLHAIRDQAKAPFDLTIYGDPQLAERMRGALSPGGFAAPHRYLRVNPPAGTIVPTAAIVVMPRGARSTELDQTLSALAGARVPHALAIVDPDQPVDVAIADAAQALAAALPEQDRLAFAHHLPAFRPAVAEVIIEETARANASFAFTSGLAETVPILTAPLNLGDMVVLTKNQLVMGYRLVLASGRDGEPKTLIGELLGVLGGGLLFRQMARQLVGLIPIAGIVPKVAIAYGGTWAVGRAVMFWVTEGRPATSEAVRTFSREGLERGRAVAKDIVARGRTGVARASNRFTRLRTQLPGLRRRARLSGEAPHASSPPPLPPPQLPPVQS